MELDYSDYDFLENINIENLYNDILDLNDNNSVRKEGTSDLEKSHNDSINAAFGSNRLFEGLPRFLCAAIDDKNSSYFGETILQFIIDSKKTFKPVDISRFKKALKDGGILTGTLSNFFVTLYREPCFRRYFLASNLVGNKKKSIALEVFLKETYENVFVRTAEVDIEKIAKSIPVDGIEYFLEIIDKRYLLLLAPCIYIEEDLKSWDTFNLYKKEAVVGMIFTVASILCVQSYLNTMCHKYPFLMKEFKNIVKIVPDIFEEVEPIHDILEKIAVTSRKLKKEDIRLIIPQLTYLIDNLEKSVEIAIFKEKENSDRNKKKEFDLFSSKMEKFNVYIEKDKWYDWLVDDFEKRKEEVKSILTKAECLSVMKKSIENRINDVNRKIIEIQSEEPLTKEDKICQLKEIKSYNDKQTELSIELIEIEDTISLMNVPVDIDTVNVPKIINNKVEQTPKKEIVSIVPLPSKKEIQPVIENKKHIYSQDTPSTIIKAIKTNYNNDMLNGLIYSLIGADEYNGAYHLSRLFSNNDLTNNKSCFNALALSKTITRNKLDNFGTFNNALQEAFISESIVFNDLQIKNLMLLSTVLPVAVIANDVSDILEVIESTKIYGLPNFNKFVFEINKFTKKRVPYDNDIHQEIKNYDKIQEELFSIIKELEENGKEDRFNSISFLPPKIILRELYMRKGLLGMIIGNIVNNTIDSEELQDCIEKFSDENYITFIIQKLAPPGKAATDSNSVRVVCAEIKTTVNLLKKYVDIVNKYNNNKPDFYTMEIVSWLHDMKEITTLAKDELQKQDKISPFGNIYKMVISSIERTMSMFSENIPVVYEPELKFISYGFNIDMNTTEKNILSAFKTK